MRAFEKHTVSRRSFLVGTVAAGATMFMPRNTAKKLCAAEKLHWLPDGIYPRWQDEVTGVEGIVLVRGVPESEVVYQTHPMWTPEMDYFLFMARPEQGGLHPHLLEIRTGESRLLLDGNVHFAAMAWRSRSLYYFADGYFHEADVVDSFQGRGEPRVLGALPPECARLAGALTVDASGEALYFGASLVSEGEWGIYVLSLKDGQSRLLCKTDFRIGHFQANPYRPGSLMFCQETGGDANQRIWHIQDGGSAMKPLYQEEGWEWVTHECWWGQDRFLFTVWPYDEERKNKPHGIMMADLESGPQGKMTEIVRYPAWHTHGSPDGKWLLGDDFDRSLWLINGEEKERRLLTAGHTSGDFKTHPHASFTPDSRAIVFSSSKFGAREILLISLPDWKDLK
jgi:oligogalacturonide lyase